MGQQWTGDAAIIAKMDASPILAEIHARLGPLLQPTEDAVVGGWTLEAIGRRECGHQDKQRASAVGKAFVYRGLGVVGGLLEEPPIKRKLKGLGLN